MIAMIYRVAGKLRRSLNARCWLRACSVMCLFVWFASGHCSAQDGVQQVDEQSAEEKSAGNALTSDDDHAIESREAVERLLADLDGRRLATRQGAERELIGLGPAILELLPESTEGLSAEAAQRLRRVRQTLQEERAKQAAGAKLIRIGEVTNLETALTRITDLSGVPFQVPGGLNPTIAVTMDSPQTFWITLDTVLDAAGADVDYYMGDPGELGIRPRNEGRRSRTDSAAYAGVYRLEAASVVARRDLQTPELSGVSIAGEIAWEPRLTPIALTLPLDTVVAVLDDGQRLRPEQEVLTISANPSISFSQFNIPLPLPTDAPREIKSLTGKIRSVLPGATEHFQVDLGKKHEAETAGNVTVLVEDVRENNELYEVRLEISFMNAGPAFESHRQWIFDNPAYVTTQDGSRLEVLGTQTYRQAADRIGISYIFDLGKDPSGKTFHYVTPVSIVENEVDFVLRDIPLP